MMTYHGTKVEAVDLVFTGSQQLVAGCLSLMLELINATIHSVAPLMHLMRTLSVYLRLMQATPTTMSFLMSDSIQLIDALGTKHFLPSRVSEIGVSS